ncbi:MAG: hypothetical protein R3268_05920 [Acidiferrobacterales bacterium]|nr:hypothetical protein [Acidiferrobacterales bacterium]
MTALVRGRVQVKGSQQLKNALRELKSRMCDADVSVLVGVPKAAGEYEGGPHIATIAAVNNYGSADGRIPARPFLLPAIENNQDKYLKIAENMLTGEALDPSQYRVALEAIGLKATADVQEYMTDLRFPANADSTIERKKSSNPLIDTGILRSSITYQITDPGEQIDEGIG